MSELPADIDAIRTRCAWLPKSRTQVVRARGETARETALFVLSSRLHLRDAQARQSLFLDASGKPIADVVVCADDEDFLFLVDGAIDAATHLHAHARPGTTIEDVRETHEIIDVHGAWAWELVSEVLGADLVALPYLNFFRIDEGLCVRAGRTGEFGYHLVVRREEADGLRERIRAAGVALDLGEVGAEAIAHCGFENWFFDADHVPDGATPVELQLEWRLASDRDFLGRAAVDAHRPLATEHLVCIVAERELVKGDAITLAGERVGRVTRAAFSHARGGWIASALVDRALAHGGIDRFVAGDVPVRTVAPPLVDNRSLYVDPRRHAYRARDEIRFGPLVRAGRARMEPR